MSQQQIDKHNWTPARCVGAARIAHRRISVHPSPGQRLALADRRARTEPHFARSAVMADAPAAADRHLSIMNCN
jgi:hypothetical protein